MKKKAVFNWSGGKDSALALHEIHKQGDFDIKTLLTSVNESYNRVSMHGVRRELLYAQAEALGLPLTEILLPEMPSMETYEQRMSKQMEELKAQGITHSIFGDIFLEDLRIYREEKLRQIGMEAVFPLWKRDTRGLVEEFIDLGFKTVLVCVKAELLPQEFAGRVLDRELLNELPHNVDPAGENGEFHTFVYDGPIFSTPVRFSLGETVFRSYTKPQQDDDNCFSAQQEPSMGFYYKDLLPEI